MAIARDRQTIVVLPKNAQHQARSDGSRIKFFESLEDLTTGLRRIAQRYGFRAGTRFKDFPLLVSLPPCSIEIETALNWGAPIDVKLAMTHRVGPGISVLYTEVTIYVYGHTLDSVLRSIFKEGGLGRLHSTSIPRPIMPILHFLQVLELDAPDKWLPEMLGGFSSSDDSDSESSAPASHGEDVMVGAESFSSKCLFNADEFEALKAALCEESSRMVLLKMTSCTFEDLQYSDLFCSLSENRSLRQLDCTGCIWTGLEDDVQSCESSNVLEEAKFSTCTFDDKAAMSLAGLIRASPFLSKLSLVGNDWPIGPILRDVLESSRSALVELDLSDFDGGNEVLEGVATILRREDCALRVLNLSNSRQEINLDAISKSLTTNRSLTEINLSSSSLLGMERFASALQENSVLAKIDLSTAMIVEDESDTDSEDGEYIHPMSGFYTNLGLFRGVRDLDISSTFHNQELMSALSEGLRSNETMRSLRITNLRLDGNADLAEIAGGLAENRGLRRLDMSRNSFGRDSFEAIMTSLSTNNVLESLVMAGCDLDDEQICVLAKYFEKKECMTGLQKLDCSISQISNVGAKALLASLGETRLLHTLELHNSVWGGCGPPQYKCSGFEDENEKIQTILKRNRITGWPQRLHSLQSDQTSILHVLGTEVVPLFLDRRS